VNVPPESAIVPVENRESAVAELFVSAVNEPVPPLALKVTVKDESSAMAMEMGLEPTASADPTVAKVERLILVTEAAP
jgi:hypothetical protein